MNHNPHPAPPEPPLLYGVFSCASHKPHRYIVQSPPHLLSFPSPFGNAPPSSCVPVGKEILTTDVEMLPSSCSKLTDLKSSLGRTSPGWHSELRYFVQMFDRNIQLCGKTPLLHPASAASTSAWFLFHPPRFKSNRLLTLPRLPSRTPASRSV